MPRSPENSHSIAIWKGKPWITPHVIIRSIIILVFLVMVLVLELFLGVAFQNIAGLPLLLWTIFAFLLLLVITISNLLLLKATHTYVLRSDSLEIRTGILTSRSFVVAPSGFANMEVVRSVTSRILNMGDIIIRVQDEPSDKRMVMIHHPQTVAEQIRNVMAKPVVRLQE